MKRIVKGNEPQSLLAHRLKPFADVSKAGGSVGCGTFVLYWYSIIIISVSSPWNLLHRRINFVLCVSYYD